MLDFLRGIFGQNFDRISLTPDQKREVDHLVKELIEIGIKEDYLSERPGGAFNSQCHHRRAREIGSKLNLIGGMPLMMNAFQRVQKKAGKNAASHLEYAWAEIGRWLA
jgi:hypothetical protein